MPANAEAHKKFQAEVAKIDKENHKFRQAIVRQLREPATLSVYLRLGWRAHKEKWNRGKAEIFDLRHR